MNLKQGDKVLVEATVLRTYGGEDTDEAYRSVDLQLGDGQLLQTNIRNIREVESAVPQGKATKPHENKAIKAPAETKAQR